MSDRRNFALGVANGALFQLADTLGDSTLVLVALLTSLAASPILVGLIFPLRNLAWYLPQLWVSGYMQQRPMTMPVYRGISFARSLLWVAVVAGLFSLRDRGWLLATIFLVLPAIDLLGGVSAVSFMNIVAKTIPPRQRGDYFAWRLTLGGLAGVGAGFLVRAVLADNSLLAFPYNFGLLLLLAGSCAVTGMALFCLVREPAEDKLAPRATLTEQLRQARAVLAADPVYRRFLRMRAALMLAGAATPFFAVFAQRRFGLPHSDIGLYLAGYTAAGLAANFLYVRIARHGGYRQAVGLICMAGLTMVSLPLLMALLAKPLGLSAGVLTVVFISVFVLSGVREAGIGVAGNSLLLELAPPGQGPLYVGITHSTLGLVLVLAAGSGLVVAAVGFLPLFFVAAAAYVLAVWDAFHLRSA